MFVKRAFRGAFFLGWAFVEMEEGGGRAVAIRSIPVKPRRNSFAGLVMLTRCVAAREAVAGRLATVQQTMPGSIRQSARLDRDEPDRLVRRVGRLVLGFGKAGWWWDFVEMEEDGWQGGRDPVRPGQAPPKLFRGPRNAEPLRGGARGWGRTFGNGSANDAWLNQTVGAP